MNDFTRKIDYLIERLHRGIRQYDEIEQRIDHVDKRFLILNESIQTLARLIEISCLIVHSSENEKYLWLDLMKEKNFDLTNPIMERFFHRLEYDLKRSIVDIDEKQAYIQTLFLLQSPSVISSVSFS